MTPEVLAVAALPRDPNPYQRLLYDEMARLGVDVTYLGELTPSRTLNLLLLPGEVLLRGRRGLGIVHLHWVFGFRLPGRHRIRLMGLLSEAWFHVFLRALSASDVRLVWTAHNVLPHSEVFWDDVRARRALAEAADLVIVHNPSTLTALADLGIKPRASAIVPHGPFLTSAGGRRERGVDSGRPVTLAFVGVVARYKGVEDLVRAFTSLADPGGRLVIAGACTDLDLARQLRAATQTAGGRIDLHLDRLSDEALDQVLAEADVLVLPYRRVTTSGSAVLGLAAGLPLVVPDLPGLSELPSECVFRYHGPGELPAALARVMATPRNRLRAMGSAGRTAVGRVSWAEIAVTTTQLFRELEHPTVPVR